MVLQTCCHQQPICADLRRTQSTQRTQARKTQATPTAASTYTPCYCDLLLPSFNSFILPSYLQHDFTHQPFHIHQTNCEGQHPHPIFLYGRATVCLISVPFHLRELPLISTFAIFFHPFSPFFCLPPPPPFDIVIVMRMKIILFSFNLPFSSSQNLKFSKIYLYSTTEKGSQLTKEYFTSAIYQAITPVFGRALGIIHYIRKSKRDA